VIVPASAQNRASTTNSSQVGEARKFLNSGDVRGKTKMAVTIFLTIRAIRPAQIRLSRSLCSSSPNPSHPVHLARASAEHRLVHDRIPAVDLLCLQPHRDPRRGLTRRVFRASQLMVGASKNDPRTSDRAPSGTGTARPQAHPEQPLRDSVGHRGRHDRQRPAESVAFRQFSQGRRDLEKLQVLGIYCPATYGAAYRRQARERGAHGPRCH
jgi:hypothetical protein